MFAVHSSDWFAQARRLEILVHPTTRLSVEDDGDVESERRNSSDSTRKRRRRSRGSGLYTAGPPRRQVNRHTGTLLVIMAVQDLGLESEAETQCEASENGNHLSTEDSDPHVAEVTEPHVEEVTEPHVEVVL